MLHFTLAEAHKFSSRRHVLTSIPSVRPGVLAHPNKGCRAAPTKSLTDRKPAAPFAKRRVLTPPHTFQCNCGAKPIDPLRATSGLGASSARVFDRSLSCNGYVPIRNDSPTDCGSGHSRHQMPPTSTLEPSNSRDRRYGPGSTTGVSLAIRSAANRPDAGPIPNP